MGQLAQNVQVLVTLCGNGDQYMHGVAVVPLNPLGELQHTNAGTLHQMAAFRGAVGDGNGVAQISRGLRLTGMQAIAVLGLHQASLGQCLGGAIECSLPILRVAVEQDVIRAEGQHRVLL